MDTIKGLARRTTQSIREIVTHTDSSGQDEMLADAGKKVRQFQKTSEVLCTKLIHAAELIEELGKVLKSVGEEYQRVPDLQPESGQLAEDVLEVGTKLIATAQEHQKGIKNQGFDMLNSFIKGVNKLKDAEDACRKNQLEYDFFRRKVLDLRRSPPKDISRIPRNEQIMENWRVELWRATENNKAICSQLYSEGQRTIDLSVLTLTQVLGSFFSIAGGGFKQQFVNARLPVYPVAPLLPAAPLPPNPMPPFQQPPQLGGHAQNPYGQQQGWNQGQPPLSQPQQTLQQQGGWQQAHALPPSPHVQQPEWQKGPPSQKQQEQQQGWQWGQPTLSPSPQEQQQQQQHQPWGQQQPQTSGGGWKTALEPQEWCTPAQSGSSVVVEQAVPNTWAPVPAQVGRPADDNNNKGNVNGNGVYETGSLAVPSSGNQQ